MKQQLFFVGCIFISSAFLSINPILAQQKADESLWTQPYTPTHLQWLFTEHLRASYSAGEDRFVCRRITETNHPISYYSWRRPLPNDSDLTLFVRAELTEGDYALDDCTLTALEVLRHEAAQMGLTPPKVRLDHAFEQNGNTVLDSIRTYRCSISISDQIYGSSRGFQDFCQ